ncbi:Nn.00g093270.m01.CDS01 [Neocucurbitaria sp. VM-36]
MQTRSRSLSVKQPEGYNRDDERSNMHHKAASPPSASIKEGVVLSRRFSFPSQALDSGSQIEQWQKTAASEFGHEDIGIVARLLRACLDSLALLLRLLDAKSLTKREKNMLQRYHATLKLWADGHGAWHGKLDQLLEGSKHLQHTTLSILNPLCKVVLNGRSTSMSVWISKEFDECTSDSDSDSDSSGDGFEHSGIKRITEDVKTYTDCLIDLSTALAYPAVDPTDDDEPCVTKVEQRAAHEYHADLILAKYPQANADLVESLGKTSWQRYQRIKQERESNTTAPIQFETHMDPATKSHVADSEFQDSGLGTSLPSMPRTTYAETVISFMTSIAGGKRVQIPPLSAEAKAGAKFECNACGKNIRATSNRDWRKHLFLDLQPYTCFYTNCTFSATPFADRQLWSNHLELDHQFGPAWQGIECPLCLEVTETGKSAILIHFARHMEDIALAALPRDVESDAESDADSEISSDHTLLGVVRDSEDIILACTLCDKDFTYPTEFIIHFQKDHAQFLLTGSEYKKVPRTDLYRAIARLEFIFSVENLSKDISFREQMDAQGFVPLELVAAHECMGDISADSTNLIRLACPRCPRLSNIEYRSDHGSYRIRRRSGWSEWTLAKNFRDESIHSEAGNRDTVLPPLGTQRLPESPLGDRSKVYKLSNNDWLDLGTGYCVIGKIKDKSKIIVMSEDHPGECLLDVSLTTDRPFQKQSNQHILWTEPDGTDMALSFQELDGCAYIWNFIAQAVRGIVLDSGDTSTNKEKKIGDIDVAWRDGEIIYCCSCHRGPYMSSQVACTTCGHQLCGNCIYFNKMPEPRDARSVESHKGGLDSIPTPGPLTEVSPQRRGSYDEL